MRDRMWDNPEIRGTVIRMAFIMAAFMAAFALCWQMTTARLHATVHERSLAIIGQLASSHPEWADEAAAAFARTPTQEQTERGRAAAARYGYDETLPLRLDDDFSRYRDVGIAVGAGGFALLLALLLFDVLRSFRSMYRHVDSYAVLAERIVEGDFSRKAHRPAEGVFSKLAHQFNQMSNRLELTLERLQLEKETMKEFLSDISHQLKTPLAGVKLMNELLQGGAGRQEAVRQDFLAKSAEQIERMEWLIRQLLTVARLEAGSVALHREELPMRLTVEQAIEAVSPQWRAKGIRMNVRTDGDDNRAFPHDPEWLREAVGNVIKNSIEHAPAGSDIDIELQETPVLSRVVIRDRGPGIAAADFPHLFKRFYKGRGGPAGGTGIGLAMAKAIVERHDGFISVRSTPGMGTTLTLTFARTVGAQRDALPVPQ